MQAGPSGSQFGVLGAIFVEFLFTWQYTSNPCLVLLKYLLIMLPLFLLGLLPWIDNYSHLVGLLFGTLLSFALFPHATVSLDVLKRIFRRKRAGQQSAGQQSRRAERQTSTFSTATAMTAEELEREERRTRFVRLATVLLSFSICAAIFALLLLWFYVVPITHCTLCGYLNCIPFTDKFCENMQVAIDSSVPGCYTYKF